MKNIIKLSVLSLLLGVGITSCDLDRYPENSIASEMSLTSVSDASKWNTGFIASFRARLYGEMAMNPDKQADQLNPSCDFGNRSGEIHGWVNFNSDENEIATAWSNLYKGLINPNFFIANHKNIQVEEKDRDEMNMYIADAHFVRAYYYSELALRFGSPYKAATASQDLCVPLVLKYDIYDKPARATNEVIYGQIFADLEQADKLFASIGDSKLKIKLQGKAQSNIFTRDAISALKARTYLYMSEWQKAYAEAAKLIASKRYPLIKPDLKAMEAMWRNDESSEEIMMMSISRPDELPNSIAYFGASSIKEKKKKYPVCSPDWLPTQWMIDLFDAKDLRKNIYFDASQMTFYGGYKYKGLTVISKFKGNPLYAANTTDQAWGIIPNSVIAPKAFRIAETYLIAAEAAYKLNDEANAKKYLNALRKSRGLADVTVSGDALFQEIKDERTRELAFEGFRLWDLRRWGMPMERHDHQTLKGNYDFLTKDFLNTKIPANHYKMVWAIPYRDLQTNPNLKGQQNPGW